MAIAIIAAAVCSAARPPPTTYLLGLGKADITGAAADANLMGYADFMQTAAGKCSNQWRQV